MEKHLFFELWKNGTGFSEIVNTLASAAAFTTPSGRPETDRTD